MKKLNKKYVILIIVLLIVFPLNSQDQDSFLIVVNKSNPVKTVDIEQIKKIFLKKMTKWEDGSKIYPVDLNETSSVRKKFTKTVHKKSVSAIKAYWQKQIFTGRGVPPPEKANDKELLEYVGKNEGSIGYVSKARSIEKYEVKQIRITEK